MNKAQEFKERAAENRKLSLGQIQYRKLLNDLSQIVDNGGVKGTYIKHSKWYFENEVVGMQGMRPVDPSDVDMLYEAEEEVVRLLKADGFKLTEREPELPSLFTVQDPRASQHLERIRRSIEKEIEIRWDDDVDEPQEASQPASQGTIIMP